MARLAGLLQIGIGPRTRAAPLCLPDGGVLDHVDGIRLLGRHCNPGEADGDPVRSAALEMGRLEAPPVPVPDPTLLLDLPADHAEPEPRRTRETE